MRTRPGLAEWLLPDARPGPSAAAAHPDAPRPRPARSRGPPAPGVQRAPRIRAPAAGPPSPPPRAHSPAHGGARPGHPGRTLRASQPPGRGGWGGGRGFPESVSPLPSKLPGTQVPGSGAGWTMAGAPGASGSPPSRSHPSGPLCARGLRARPPAYLLRAPGGAPPGRSAGPEE